MHENQGTDRANRCGVKRRDLHEYFAENFYVTTSGPFRDQTLVSTILEMGADRIMFAADWPFENIADAESWFDGVPISDADRDKIGRGNACRLFKLA